MKVELKVGMELEIFDSPNTSEVAKFTPGTILDFDICDFENPPIARELQFGNGQVTFVNSEFWNNVEILEY
jgi:hypothetical protein